MDEATGRSQVEVLGDCDVWFTVKVLQKIKRVAGDYVLLGLTVYVNLPRCETTLDFSPV